MRSGNFKSLLLIAAVLTAFTATGCAQRKTAVIDSEQIAKPAPSLLQSVSVTDSGAVDVKLDKPAPYTFYKLENPLRGVIDISQAETGSVPAEISSDKISSGKINVSRQSSAGVSVVRIEIPLASDVDFNVNTDSADKARFIAKIKSAPKAQPSAEIKPEKAVDSVKEAKVLPSEEKTDIKKPKVKPANLITSISALPDGIQFEISGDVSNYNAFKLSKPERVVVDLFGITNSLSANTLQLNSNGINQARIGMTRDKIRIVLDSSKDDIPPYTIQKNGKGLLMQFEDPSKSEQKAAYEAPEVKPVTVVPVESKAEAVKSTLNKEVEPVKPVENKVAEKSAASVQPASPTVAAVPVFVPESAQKSASSSRPIQEEIVVTALPSNEVSSIDFKVDDLYSHIIIKAGSSCKTGKPVKTADGQSLTLTGCKMPKNLQRFIDTSAFPSVVKGITPFPLKVKRGTDSRILAKLRAEAPSSVSRKGDTIVWDIKNTEIPQKSAEDARVPKLNHEVKSVPVEQEVALPSSVKTGSQLTEKAKVYTGRRVTLEFSDADIRKIFQLIAEVSNLNFLIGDDVTGQISIKLVNVPWDQALDVILETKQLAMKRDGNIVQIRPKSKMVSLEEEERMAKEALEKSMDLKTVIFDVNYAKVDDVNTQFNAIKSKRGTITKDSRTNRIIVKDIQPAIDDMKFLLKNLDLPERQVMIEARIVEASSNFTRDLGVKWNAGYLDGSASKFNINSVDSSFGGVVSSSLPTTTTGGLAMGMSFGKLTSNMQLDMRLSAAATIGQVKVISTPKVLTLNNKKAKISQGQSIPYQTVSAEGTKTEFVEAVLTLEVTPHITSDGSVSMEIKASNNSVGSGTPPPINKKEATTELVLKNGETTVIGGIYIDSDTVTETGVPFLMDIPMLGWLFKSNSKNKTKTELLIFITPKVIS